MAEIKDCIGKNVKISKCSITIKSEEGKTCGVVQFHDIQTNKQMEYFHSLRKSGVWGSGNFDMDSTDTIRMGNRNGRKDLYVHPA